MLAEAKSAAVANRFPLSVNCIYKALGTRSQALAGSST